MWKKPDILMFEISLQSILKGSGKSVWLSNWQKEKEKKEKPTI